jgi:hypothetical protein
MGAPVKLILLILAFLLLLLSAFGVNHPRVNTAYLGLSLFVLSFIIT